MKDRAEKKYIWMIIGAILLIWQLLPVQKEYAQGEERIDEIMAYRNEIVHIEAVCWDGKDTVYSSKSFSGAVVARDASTIYIATICDGLTCKPEEKEKIKKKFELENNSSLAEKIDVIFNGDLRIEASIVGQSEQRNLSILKLNQNINMENICSFAKENVSDKEPVFLLSFPKMDNAGNTVYNAENVHISQGNVTGLYKKNDVIFFKHNIKADHDSLGGAMLNEEGMLVGILLKSQGEESGTAISGNEIKTLLDTFHITYEEKEEQTVKKPFPVLQVILGIVIFFLLLEIFLQQKKNHAVEESEKREKSKHKKQHSEIKTTEKKKNGIKKKVWLEYTNGKKIIKIQKTPFVIGRAKEVDLILNGDQEISRKHACIQFDGKNFYLTDMNSTNHTFLNGVQIKSGETKILKNGDEIGVAKEKMIFRDEE